jgi:ribA/ribD-fused uncharacterized protein
MLGVSNADCLSRVDGNRGTKRGIALYSQHSKKSKVMRLSKKDYHFFWSKKSVLSQWYRSPFVDDDGQKYITAEQYMMAEKARLFGDSETRLKILQSDDPKTCKNLGRKVKGFDQTIWEGKREDIVYNGSLLKYAQNKDLKNALLLTADKCLVEASPYDKIWGIGMTASQKGASNPLCWKGLNLLGYILMRVREKLCD